MSSISTETIPHTISPEVVFFEACERNEHVAVAPYLQTEKILDRIVAAILLIPAAPIIGILVFLIRITSKGPGIFKQERVGLNGKSYTMYKLRSMRCDAEKKTGPVWSSPNDSRLTLIGRIVRKAHLDELPQLWNIVKGEMSLVGPRPERPEFVRVLEEKIPGYCDRLRVLPGITGLAQVNLPPDTNLASVRAKVSLDVEYVRTANLWLDIRLLICTFLKMCCVTGCVRTRLTGVGRTVDPTIYASPDSHTALTPDSLLHASNGRPHKPK